MTLLVRFKPRLEAPAPPSFGHRNGALPKPFTPWDSHWKYLLDRWGLAPSMTEERPVLRIACDITELGPLAGVLAKTWVWSRPGITS